ncbi:MAG: polyprenyl synthetase family protein [Muribaculum sp.]|nr:polyprenyl synthetase family protein [Muribaculum sp.]
MNSEKQYLAMIANAIAAINYPQEPAGLYDPIKYTLDCGGKRLRPTLLLAAAEACGANPAKAIKQAIGLEMFHNFTLLHDDVMDNADTRRGRPTVHVKWDYSAAILSGDAMLTMATQLISDCPDNKLRRVLALFNKTAMEIYEGQQYDIDFEKIPGKVSVDQYMNMIRLKTSVLLGCACKMGSLIADASTKTQDAMYNYGVNLGMAFQLQDDWLDTFGKPEIFGKNIGGDILNDKQTFLLIDTLSRANSQQRQKMEHMTGSRSSEKISYFTQLYTSLGAEQQCRSLIEQYGKKAVGSLADADISDEAVLFFSNLANASLTRSK